MEINLIQFYSDQMKYGSFVSKLPDNYIINSIQWVNLTFIMFRIDLKCEIN